MDKRKLWEDVDADFVGRSQIATQKVYVYSGPKTVKNVKPKNEQKSIDAS